MKKYVGFCLVMSISTAAVCSEGPRKALEGSQEIIKSALEGHKSGPLRGSTDKIIIAATSAKVKNNREKFYSQFSPEGNRAAYSSGSNPIGAEHLFPGQRGNGLLVKIAPIHLSDPNCDWYK